MTDYLRTILVVVVVVAVILTLAVAPELFPFIADHWSAR